MAQQLTIGLHNGGSIAMRADGPEEAVAFDRPGRLLRLNVDEAECGFADADIVLPDRMPEGRHAAVDTVDGDRICAGMEPLTDLRLDKAAETPIFYRRHVWQTRQF